MRTIILITALFFSFANVWGQKDILNYYSKIKPTTLPYHGSNSDEVYPSYFNHSLNISEWVGNPINIDTWIDLGLTKSQDESDGGLQTCSIFRTFIPTNGNYKLMAIYLSGSDSGKSILISIKDNGEYIDVIEIAVEMLITVHNKSILAYPKQWSLSTDMKMTVYQLKPTSRTPLMFNANITFPLQAQRIDRTYQISSTGQFSLLSTKLYQPKTYPLSSFTDENYKIKDGNETPLP